MTNPFEKNEQNDQKPNAESEKQPAENKTEDDAAKRLALDDLANIENKSHNQIMPGETDQQRLDGREMDKYFGTGLTARLGRELSGQPGNKPLNESKPGDFREFKWSGAAGMGNPGGITSFAPGDAPFFQGRKAEFLKPEENKTPLDLQFKVDKLLNDTQPKEEKFLTEAQIQELNNSRDKLAQSSNTDELLLNAVGLARLFQELQCLEEAKRALEFSLGIDPEHMAGKQLFSELERMQTPELHAGASPLVSHLLSKNSLRARIQTLSAGKVVVIGDLLIDELLEGKPERISREAPVLILEHVDTVLIPGGAANTAHNISALGGTCHAVGICGTDEYAGRLATLLESHGVTHSLVHDPTRPTTVKTRILSKSHSLLQQLLRLDRISHHPISSEIESLLIAELQESVPGYQAVVLSDYRAGVITDRVINACRTLALTQDILIIVDAQGDFNRFKDVTLMTPNQPDTEKAVGFALSSTEALKKAGEQILNSTHAGALLITRGAEGMVLFQQGQELVELPAFNRSEVFDVTGAGDTVVATMALALVSGSSFVEAMALGNLAAGIVVRKSGTAVTSQKELLENLERLDLPEY